MKFLLIFVLIGSLTVSCSSDGSSRNENKTDNIQPDAIKKRTASNSWLGKWERLIWKNDASFEVKNIKSDSIEFALFAFSGGHMGEIEGMAIVNDNLAIFSHTDESDTCRIHFKLIGDSVITIDQKQGSCFAGMAVTYDGVYKKPTVQQETGTTETLTSLGIFKNEKEDSTFKSLVGDDYSIFLNSTQLTSEDEDLDGLNATVRSSGVRGLFTFMENIIMIDAASNIWAAVIDDNKIYYYTNTKEYKESIPKTIQHWRERFKDYPIIYK
jgi:hypothetical protein